MASRAGELRPTAEGETANALRDYRDLDIDWSMTPCDAVTQYLSGQHPAGTGRVVRQPVRSKDDYSNYFVIYTGTVPKVMSPSQLEQARSCLLYLPGTARAFPGRVGHLLGVFPQRRVKECLRAR